MAYPDARIYLLNNEGIQEVAYADTEHYLVTRGFLTNPQRTLSVLFAEEKAGEPVDGADDPGEPRA
jgi:hypothetical protein